MFLKRIEMQGFKSFADHTVITFEHAVTGVVGPNGCGKSNIADAVRWVLGEQSAKSLRGERMNDVIFAGSSDRRKVNMAYVSLVFDNTSRVFHSDLDEIEVTRKLYRDSGDAEYLINRNNVRLRDVVELFMDTGLGRDSLSIISQGNVISFAEAKPLERRGVFEEAAGVAKYKKRKIESIAKLQRTEANLDRIRDIASELEKQVSPLKRAARKAEIYREKKKRLEEIEITVLVNEVENAMKEIERTKQSLFDLETASVMMNTNIQINDTRILEARRKSRDLDLEIVHLQDELMTNISNVQALESRRTELEEKRKYLIETADRETRTKELEKQLETARVEYEDRKGRLDKLNAETEILKNQLNTTAAEIITKQSEYDIADNRRKALDTRKHVLESMMRNPFNNQSGIKAVMDNTYTLKGILGVIGQNLDIKEGYEQAVSTALGGAVSNIVTTDEEAARNAIRFLNRNQSGRATFLPVTVCRPSYVSRENQIICDNTEGYLGNASDFVTCDDKFAPVVARLLNNVLVTDTMENGNELSSRTGRNYKIVTLNGEVIHRGGSMTGGKNRNDTNILTVKREYEQVKQQLDAESARAELAEKSLLQARRLRGSISEQLQEKRFAAASLEPVVDAKKAKYDKVRNDLSLLEPEHTDSGESHADELIVELNEAYARRDEITNEIKAKREERASLTADTDRKEAQLRQLRKDYSRSQDEIRAIQIDKSKFEFVLEQNLQRIASEYQMTYEYAKTRVTGEVVENAREEVAALRAEIDRLGNINMNAPEEYSEVNARYEEYQKNIEELSLSRDKILSGIDEMDSVMKKQFREMFDKINVEFNDIFRSLYGGGKARLVLQDPSDLLNTGIDIDAQPPGKAVQNNLLFSGGEKSLIALCVLFAILKVKPVPLVILDEVEAALDPGNVERFAQYLHVFTDQTQFIVVTHRTGTMQSADVLYGVTMQQQGVSQMLKVELHEAMDLADPQEVSS
ncbi:MAG: AAA family ATPase [Solobacterium sp.]|nr:AAA family ATPase [Solobacterium sp.]